MSFSGGFLSDVTELKGRTGSTVAVYIILGASWPSVEGVAVYAWDATSTQTPDDDEYVLPDGQSVGTAGRWNKVDISFLNADWAASSGQRFILNKPSIPAAQVNSDWNAGSGAAQILNKPTIPSAPVNADWNAGSGLAQILNKPTLPAAPSQSLASRSLNTAFQVHASRNARAQYTVQVTVTASIAGGQNGEVVLEIASDSGFTTNVQTLDIFGGGQTYTLALALQGVQPSSGSVRGFVPAGYYVRLRTVSNVGSPGFSFRVGQEVLE